MISAIGGGRDSSKTRHANNMPENMIEHKEIAINVSPLTNVS